MATQRSRRSQKERSDITRLALMNAAIALMYRNGMAHTSTADIAREAGVSRGALTHHFDSREDLITSAIEHMLRIAIDELSAFTVEFVAKDGGSDDIVDFLWGLMDRQLFLVTLEYLPEARHNDAFRQRLVPVVSAWHQALDRIWTELGNRYGADPDFVRGLMNATMCLIRGMIAQTILRDDPPYYARMLAGWKRELARQLQRPDETMAPLPHKHAGGARG